MLLPFLAGADCGVESDHIGMHSEIQHLPHEFHGATRPLGLLARRDRGVEGHDVGPELTPLQPVQEGERIRGLPRTRARADGSVERHQIGLDAISAHSVEEPDRIVLASPDECIVGDDICLERLFLHALETCRCDSRLPLPRTCADGRVVCCGVWCQGARTHGVEEGGEQDAQTGVGGPTSSGTLHKLICELEAALVLTVCRRLAAANQRNQNLQAFRHMRASPA
mmetsp:Transcript_60857/g.174497  ORF Transcript_60857/g.174497 Transcript_60857/m.174497 type:complete len:225 (+) Transcript_60857:247-921(+)